MTNRIASTLGPLSACLVFFGIICLLSSPVLAVSEEEAHQDHSSNSLDFIGKLVNFIVLFGGLTFLLRKPISRYLTGRSEEISHSLSESEISRKDAEKELKKAKNRLKKISQEVKAIEREGREQGKRLQEEIIRSSQKEKVKLIEMTKQEIGLLTQQGVEEIREHMADLTTSLAREKIIKKIGKKEQSRSIDRSINMIGELHEAVRSD